LKTGMASGLAGNHTACNGVPFIASMPAWPRRCVPLRSRRGWSWRSCGTSLLGLTSRDWTQTATSTISLTPLHYRILALPYRVEDIEL
jgi:hypothetical protein